MAPSVPLSIARRRRVRAVTWLASIVQLWPFGFHPLLLFRPSPLFKIILSQLQQCVFVKNFNFCGMTVCMGRVFNKFNESHAKGIFLEEVLAFFLAVSFVLPSWMIGHSNPLLYPSPLVLSTLMPFFCPMLTKFFRKKWI